MSYSLLYSLLCIASAVRKIIKINIHIQMHKQLLFILSKSPIALIWILKTQTQVNIEQILKFLLVSKLRLAGCLTGWRGSCLPCDKRLLSQTSPSGPALTTQQDPAWLSVSRQGANTFLSDRGCPRPSTNL